ncbi:MAG: peptidase U34 [Flavobacteriia bacterium]|nr:MAG: peptidase U34 [Flavobacteriia bacterium]
MCDTFIALPGVTEDHSMIFAKNSDREANEAQVVEFWPQKEYPAGEKLQCTYIEIPQAGKTYGILISRPFWMWGAEMGVNEHGVVIGNEAVFTKLKVKKEKVLTGMDLLRLALERTESAVQAKDLIVEYLEKYGQGGRAGYEDKEFSYHNSFLIADKKEAWVLETAGRFWAAKKVTDFYAISNGLTIGNDYDEIHPEAIEFAQKKGWIKGEFHFAMAFSDFLFTTFSACKARRSRAEELLKHDRQKINLRSAIAHLRDHHDKQFSPSKPLLGNTICAHAGNSLTRNASQTVGSMIVHFTATSAPCLSVFKPIDINSGTFSDSGKPKEKYKKDFLWWKHEVLHREILKDYKNRKSVIQKELEVFQTEIIEQFQKNRDNDPDLTHKIFQKNYDLLEEWIDKVRSVPVKDKPNFIYRNYWKKMNKKAGIPVE